MPVVLTRLCSKRGLIYAFVCAVLITVTDLFVKLAIDQVSVLQLTSIRMAVVLMCSMPSLVYREDGKYLWKDSRKERKLLAVRSLFATASTVFIMFAYSYTDMGNASAVFNSMPVFSGLIGKMFLKEKFTKMELLFSLVSLTGVCFISQPPFIFPGKSDNEENNSHFVGSVFALAGAIVTAVSFVQSRLLSNRNVHSMSILFYYAVAGTAIPASMNFLLSEWSFPPCGLARLFILLTGVFNFAGQTLLIEALKIEKPVRVTVTLTLNILLAFAVQFIFLGKAPDIFSAFGATAIFVASIGIALQKSKPSAQNIVTDPDPDDCEISSGMDRI